MCIAVNTYNFKKHEAMQKFSSLFIPTYLQIEVICTLKFYPDHIHILTLHNLLMFIYFIIMLFQWKNFYFEAFIHYY